MRRISPGLMLSIAILGGCLPSYDNIPTKGNPAMRKNAEFRSKWNEPGKYRYTYYYFQGMGSHTERGECIIGDTVACAYNTSIGEEGISKRPGRISGLFDMMDSVLIEMDPDSIQYETPYSYAMIEWSRDDSLSFPFGYEVYFNAERSYIDSLFFLPFGPNIRIRTMTID